MALASELHPHVILLDIQMPGCSGMDVAACLWAPRPQVIFCTAYDQYAVEAFELGAVDYLLKPVTRSRLSQALDRIRSLPAGAGCEEGTADLPLRHRQSAPARFLGRKGSQFAVVEGIACPLFWFRGKPHPAGGGQRRILDGPNVERSGVPA